MSSTITRPSRRRLLTSPLQTDGRAPARVRWAATTTPAPPPDPVVHLLSRISFGITPAALELARQLGREQALERQLDPEAIDDQAVDELLTRWTPTISLDTAQLFELERGQVVREIVAATVLRCLFSERQLFEVMVDFWSNHFNVYVRDGAVALLKTADDRDVIRRHALGSFRELLHASAKSPAMLYYLDNYVNTAAGPNENYARELLELHSLGVDGGFSQADVQEVALCFTGWRITAPRSGEAGQFVFDPRGHAGGTKIVLGEPILSTGLGEGEEVLDRLAEHPATARFVCTKLCRRFVADDPPESLIGRAAATFTATDGDIRAVLRTILLSDEMDSAADQKVKRPLELVGAIVRGLGLDVDERGARTVADLLGVLDQVPFSWPAPNGYPDSAGAWATTSGLLARWNFALDLGAGRLRGIRIDWGALLDGLRSPTPTTLVDHLIDRLLHRPMLDADREATIVLAAGTSDPHRALSAQELVDRAGATVALLLDSPYFQYR